jgi:protein TonB
MSLSDLYGRSKTNENARHSDVAVLVGTDGRASEIRVIRGVGFGLDERAAQTVHGWKFKPARDTSQRSVAAWITVEAVFGLF